MTDETWDATPDEIYDESPSEYTTFVRVNGMDQPLEPGMKFAILKDVAREAGLGKFRVFTPPGTTNPDDEIRPRTAPDMITEGMQLELRPYDKAGN